MMTDEDLLRAFARDRSRAAFDEIVRRHGGMVFGVCRRSLGDLQEAEDAAQSVFLIFLEKAPRLGQGTVLAAWLYRTAVFVARNQIRARIRRESRSPQATPAAGEPAWEEAKPYLDDALARLPQRLQDALVVHYLQGKTLVETAAALNCPVKTLEKRVGKGLERLRTLLGGAGVAISSAALVALLQQEARGSVPIRMEEALRARPIPPAAPPVGFLLRKLLFPAAAALVGIAFIAASLRHLRQDSDEANARPRRATPDSRSVGNAGTRGPKSGAAPSTAAAAAPSPRFPATFEEFSARYRRMRACPEAIDRWTALGIDLRPDELLAAAARVKDDDVDGVIVGIFGEWSRREPRAAANWLYRACDILPPSLGWKVKRPDGSGEGKATLLETVLENWYSHDAPAAEAWMKELPSGAARNTVAVDLAIAAGRHPQGRFDFLSALLDELPPSWPRRVATAQLAGEWARRDPAAAAAWVLRLPAPEPQIETPGLGATFTLSEPESDYGLRPFASQVEPDDDESPPPMVGARIAALDKIARIWAASDVEAARQWGENLSNPEDRTRVMESIGEVWAATDCAAALEYARAHPGASWRDFWLRTMALSLASTDRGAAEGVARLASDAERPSLMTQVLVDWGETRPAEAAGEILRAMSELAEESAEDRFSGALSAISRAWGRKDPVRAAAWAAAIEREEIRSLAIRNVANEWAQSDPRAALNWVNTLPPGDGRTHALASALAGVASTDPELAAKVVHRLKTEEGRFDVRSSIATSWGKLAPEAAMTWARSLAPDEGRDCCIQMILTSWAAHDPEAAGAQVESIIDENVKAQALKDIEECRWEAERQKVRKALLRPSR